VRLRIGALCCILIVSPFLCSSLCAAKGDDLLVACTAGDLSKTKALIASGADVNVRDEYGETPLHKAVLRRFREVVAVLLAKGADPNAKANNGFTPLHFAVRTGQTDLVETLIAKGAKVDARSDFGTTPLFIAVANGRKSLAELLIAKGADWNLKARDGKTPLDYAKDFDHLPVVALLRRREVMSKSRKTDVAEAKRPGEDFATVVKPNELASKIRQVLPKHSLMVTFILDRTGRSFAERKQVAEEVCKQVKALVPGMPRRQVARLKWVLITANGGPTRVLIGERKIDKVIEAIDDLEPAKGSSTNLAAALKFTMDDIAVLRRPLFVVFSTEEESLYAVTKEQVDSIVEATGYPNIWLFLLISGG